MAVVNPLKSNLDNNYFRIYLILFLFLYITYMMFTYKHLVNNAMSEWVINYQGGFVRRGLLGEIFYQISTLLSINLRNIIYIFLVFIFIIYFFLIYKLFRLIELNFLTILAFYSPLFLSFEVYELEALGRKELLYYIFFLSNILLYKKYNNINLNYLSLLIFGPVLILINETVLFYCGFYFLFFFLLEENKNINFFIKNFFIVIVLLIFALLIWKNPHNVIDQKKMCDALKNIGDACGLAAHFTVANIKDHIKEVGWQTPHIIRYSLIIITGFFPILTILLTSVWRNKFIYKNYLILFLILLNFFISSSMYIVSVDSGRWTSIMYHHFLILTFGLIYLKKIEFNYQNNFFNLWLNSFNLPYKIKKNLYIFLIILLCFSWNPKAVYHEKIGSFPLYRSVIKWHKFYSSYLNNYLNFNK